MTEKLLQYIWQFQHFNNRNLVSNRAEPLQVIFAGNLNSNQGPDFLNAKIKTGDTTWAGNIEIHVKASEWDAHGHSNDPNYRNIILHVVWQNDLPDVLPFPTLELQPHTAITLLNRYDELMHSAQFIPCQQHIRNVGGLSFTAWKERLAVERLQARAQHIQELLQKNNQHWEEVFWWMLARNFGMKINMGSFERIAQSLPLTILARHKNQIHQLEALLMGQAGLLDKIFEDDYPNLLRREYQFLQKKYSLRKAHAPLYFLRMRPANFPSIRLAQLAMLVHQSHHLFSIIKENESLRAVQELLNVTANDYWHYHYKFDEETAFRQKNLGQQMIENICVNTIVPMLFAYGHFNKQTNLVQKALAWLGELSAEKNAISQGFCLFRTHSLAT
ncbi:MAG: DUF2851 family protein [Chitinophagaceae bacterium]|nr:MAG: DUF2851 family protein [Chitinophagaceae bacterium]